METHTFATWLGYFFTATAIGMGWVLGCAVGALLWNLPGRIARSKA